MNPLQDDGNDPSEVSMIDEVRRIRCRISDEFGHDVDRLCDHLATVSDDYAARRGAFAGLTKERAARVVESWGEGAHLRDDPVVDEVRAIRRSFTRWAMTIDAQRRALGVPSSRISR